MVIHTSFTFMSQLYSRFLGDAIIFLQKPPIFCTFSTIFCDSRGQITKNLCRNRGFFHNSCSICDQDLRLSRTSSPPLLPFLHPVHFYAAGEVREVLPDLLPRRRRSPPPLLLPLPAGPECSPIRLLSRDRICIITHLDHDDRQVLLIQVSPELYHRPELLAVS